MDTRIKDFIEFGGDGVIQIPVLPLNKYSDYIKSLGYQTKDFDVVNGWDKDFWLYFHKGDQSLCLAGSLWYGNYTLTKETIHNVTSKD